MNPAKLKVVELRAELAARGLDTKGNKAALVERLQEALNGENGGGVSAADNSEATSDAANSTAESVDLKLDETQEKIEEEASGDNSQEVIENTQTEGVEGSETDKNPQDDTNTESNIKVEEVIKENDNKSNRDTVDEMCEENLESDNTSKGENQDMINNKNQEPTQENMEVDNVEIKVEKDIEGYEDNKMDSNNEKNVEENEKPNLKDTSNDSNDAMKNDDKGLVSIKPDPEESKMEADEKKDTSIKTETSSSSEKREDRKRKRSPSPAPQRRSWSPTKTMKEDEPEIDESAVTLSWYDSDLHLMIDKVTFCTATPISDAGFGYIWAGVRGTYGYSSGKICYQVKLLENCDVSHIEDEPTPNVLRIGWSAFKTSIQLGEEPLSYGYGGTGKISVDCKFKDYGSSYAVGDIVTAYLEYTDTEAIMSFSVNENDFGTAFTVSLEDLKGNALVPHILTKNLKFEVNFGQCDPWVPVKEDFMWANQVPIENRVAGPRRPLKRADCEMIMMCGLPGAGKTYWANKYSAENFDKHFNIIGTNALIEKMKVMGLPRKGNYSGRWDVLIEKCTKCLQRLMDIGCQRRRNFILDQTNVYPAAQRRKMRNFEGFIKKAVVIVPTDEEFIQRIQKRELEEGKDVPDSAVMEMKANFTLPDKELFNEIEYTELPESEAKILVEKYNKEAISAGYTRRGPQRNNSGSGQGSFQGSSISSVKRFRSDHPQQRPRYDNFRRGPPMHHSGGFRRGGNNAHHGARSGWQQRGPDRGWRDRNQSGSASGGYRSEMRPVGDRGMNRMGSGGWRGGGGGGGGGGSSGTGGSSGRGRGGGGSAGGGGTGTSDRNRHHMERNNRGPSSNQQRGSGHAPYDRRDNNRDTHNRQKVTSNNTSHGANNVGSSGGTISSVGGGGSGGGGGNHQWGQYQQQGSQHAAPGATAQQPWAPHHQHWPAPQQQHQQPQQQQWNNAYQWKSYGQGGGYNQAQQGFNQQGYNQQQNYGNWQGYGYTAGYGQNWPQTWPNWYGTGPQAQQPAVAAHSANTSQPPPK